MKRPAFTILELIIASSLSATMMLIVWSLFGVFTKLNEKGTDQATELQLVRSLMSQLRMDTQRLVVAGTPFSSVSEPASGLPEPYLENSASLPTGPLMVGGSERLRFLIRPDRDTANHRGRAAAPISPNRVAAPEHAETPHRLAVPNVYEVVSYDWCPDTRRLGSQPARPISSPDPAVLTGAASMDASDADLGSAERTQLKPGVGLTRRVVSWFQIQQAADANRLDLDNTTPAEVLGTPPESRPDNIEPVDDRPRAPAETDHVPEVTKLRFRYFDGGIWLNQWDSLSTGRLPEAIEVAFDLQPQREFAPADDEQVLDGTPRALETDEQESNFLEAADPMDNDPLRFRAEYRFVIAIVAAPLVETPSEVTQP